MTGAKEAKIEKVGVMKEFDSEPVSSIQLQDTGVVYMSRVPPQMTPHQVRSLLSRYGKIHRIYLTAESSSKTKKLHRKGCFVDGWIEFENKKHAKSVCSMLNGKIMGGRSISKYHDDIWNLKYLDGLKWHHLTEKFTYRNAERNQKLRMEMEVDKREANEYLKNVEKSKMVDKIVLKKGVGESSNRSQVKQRRVIS